MIDLDPAAIENILTFLDTATPAAFGSLARKKDSAK